MQLSFFIHNYLIFYDWSNGNSKKINLAHFLNKFMISGCQLRLARAALRWRVYNLSESGVKSARIQQIKK